MTIKPTMKGCKWNDAISVPQSPVFEFGNFVTDICRHDDGGSNAYVSSQVCRQPDYVVAHKLAKGLA